MASTQALRHEAICKGCSRYLKVGANVYRGMKGQGYRCSLCGPFPLPEGGTVTVLPDGRAEGAYGHQDGLRPMMSKSDARSIAMLNGGPGKMGPPRNRRRRRRKNSPG